MLDEKFNKWLSNVSHSIFPWPCLVCGSTVSKHSGICCLCRDYLPWCKQTCKTCGLPIPLQQNSGLACGQCQKVRPHFDNLKALFWYQPPIDKLITGYKYLHRGENARTLADLLVGFLKKQSLQEKIVPVPSHPKRVRERGFNAVNELVKLASKQLSIDYDCKLVCRNKNTQTQTGKNKSKRKINVKNAFKVCKPITQDHIVIFDEVVTTGATVNELSYCLKKAGVKKVTVLAIARTKSVTNSCLEYL